MGDNKVRGVKLHNNVPEVFVGSLQPTYKVDNNHYELAVFNGIEESAARDSVIAELSRGVDVVILTPSKASQAIIHHLIGAPDLKETGGSYLLRSRKHGDTEFDVERPVRSARFFSKTTAITQEQETTQALGVVNKVEEVSDEDHYKKIVDSVVRLAETKLAGSENMRPPPAFENLYLNVETKTFPFSYQDTYGFETGTYSGNFTVDVWVYWENGRVQKDYAVGIIVTGDIRGTARIRKFDFNLALKDFTPKIIAPTQNNPPLVIALPYDVTFLVGNVQIWTIPYDYTLDNLQYWGARANRNSHSNIEYNLLDTTYVTYSESFRAGFLFANLIPGTYGLKSGLKGGSQGTFQVKVGP